MQCAASLANHPFVSRILLLGFIQSWNSSDTDLRITLFSHRFDEHCIWYEATLFYKNNNEHGTLLSIAIDSVGGRFEVFVARFNWWGKQGFESIIHSTQEKAIDNFIEELKIIAPLAKDYVKEESFSMGLFQQPLTFQHQ
jgi:hypothetical protein